MNGIFLTDRKLFDVGDHISCRDQHLCRKKKTGKKKVKAAAPKANRGKKKKGKKKAKKGKKKAKKGESSEAPYGYKKDGVTPKKAPGRKSGKKAGKTKAAKKAPKKRSQRKAKKQTKRKATKPQAARFEREDVLDWLLAYRRKNQKAGHMTTLDSVIIDLTTSVRAS